MRYLDQDKGDRAQLEVLARARGVTVSELVHRLILHALRRKVSQELGLKAQEGVDPFDTWPQ